jgi:hypothetical protein
MNAPYGEILEALADTGPQTRSPAAYGHLFPDAEDLGRGAVDAIFAVALTEQERNQAMS